MSDTPMVSVLVTVYNREQYLDACLSSILSSSFQDFEVVVVDDGSTDRSVEIAERFARTDSRVRAFRNEKNLGDYPNRMRAAELARGTYIKYLDSDDLIYPHGLDVMVQAMSAKPNAVLALSHSRPEEAEPYPWELSPAEAWRKQFLGDGCMGCGPSGAIIRRAEFFEAGGFGAWGVLSDTDMWFRMSARWPIVLLPPGLVWWRRHENQEFSKDHASRRYLENGFALTVKTLATSENPMTEQETRMATERARQHHARRLLALSLGSGRPLTGLRMWRSAGLGWRDIAKGLRSYQ
ncbi:MAG: glycosyltransferase family A protein [Gemmatimonadales bacterium]